MNAKRLEEIRGRCEAAEHNAIHRVPIPGFGGYECDDAGFVWSALSNWRGYGLRRLSTELTRDGYPAIRMSVNGRRIRRPVHVLVALAFHGQPSHGQQVRHLDGEKTNSRPSNLAWGTALENAADREHHGKTARGDRNGSRLHPNCTPRGEDNGMAKLTELAVARARVLVSGGRTHASVAAELGVSRSAVQLAVGGKSWLHVNASTPNRTS